MGWDSPDYYPRESVTTPAWDSTQSLGPVIPPLGAYFQLAPWPRQMAGCEAAQDSALSLQSGPGPPVRGKATCAMPRWIGLTARLKSDASQPFLGLRVSAQALVAAPVPVCLLVRP